MTNPDPTIQAALREPANLGFVKSLVGLSELVVPGDDARNKQLREIQQLLLTPQALTFSGPESAVTRHGLSALDKTFLTAEAPLTGDFGLGATTSPPGAEDTPGPLSAGRSTVPVDELLDDHATEFEECRRWASSDAGQIARAQNPAGFANVRAHAAEHAAALARQLARQQAQTSLAPKAP